jgi:hypothetical protein
VLRPRALAFAGQAEFVDDRYEDLAIAFLRLQAELLNGIAQ